MIYRETELHGVFLIEPELKRDERGFFMRLWCRAEFEKRGLQKSFSQYSLASNEKKGTLRGMHFQRPPFQEVKLIHCIQGAIYDVVIDLRQASPTYKRWFAAELSHDNRQMLYIPEGCAHGYQTLQDHTEVVYQISMPYEREAGAGIRWNDPAFNIPWPEVPERTISQRDSVWPDFNASYAVQAH